MKEAILTDLFWDQLHIWSIIILMVFACGLSIINLPWGKIEEVQPKRKRVRAKLVSEPKAFGILSQHKG